MITDTDLGAFFSSPAFGVAGASTNRDKFGNKVLRCYQQNDRKVYGINPRATEIEGAPCVASVADLPDDVLSISVITPPAITEQVVKDAIARGIKNIWMQPGAQNPKAIEECRKQGINVIADGSCILVVLGYSDH
jgi:predicted CoA-binding protein